MVEGKVALITGSTSGIGLGIAHKLAEMGSNIMLNGLGKAEDVEKLKTDLSKEFNIKVSYSSADMSKPEQIREMIKQTEVELGGLDILVNNAGIQFVSPIEEFPDDKWDAILAINLSSAFHTIKAALPGMKKRKFGRIINIASAHGLVASANKGAYVAAKHGIVGLTKVVALENAILNVTCNAICPGWVHTPLVQKQIEDRAKNEGITIDEATQNLLSEKQPSLRFTTIEDIGNTVLFLCSEAGRSITGTALPVDGGWTAR
ncbi:dehydrogenase [endosymbiont of Acanthamoeba sp. UWC8]|uniref:3-hydroxybutyrate dehydrogenase n=1 Tax=endosymbiont of Acanthamoeba sp. UWC8 TaxID=86106 RepID=UPI0004D1CF1A|nr:3-hydroxybutyrate dehydrogenase [endosymbiont of Acanthamoeba sp. UWC8]AIF81798.1 dehydrogenase [endosymbiont of Acanthamoeba sp. UWC8]